MKLILLQIAFVIAMISGARLSRSEVTPLFAATRDPQPLVLDLTARIDATKQGNPGLPGGHGGGYSGGPLFVDYELPLKIALVRQVANERGDFVLEVSVENTGRVPFELPVSTDLTTIERAGNANQTLLFFKINSLPMREGAAVGFGEVGGSTSIPGSFKALEPHAVAKILLLAESKLARRFGDGKDSSVRVNAECFEWKLRDNEYFVESKSKTVISENSSRLPIKP